MLDRKRIAYHEGHDDLVMTDVPVLCAGAEKAAEVYLANSGRRQHPRSIMVTETHPFETIEGTQEFIGLLKQSIDEAMCDVQQDLQAAANAGDERRTHCS